MNQTLIRFVVLCMCPLLQENVLSLNKEALKIEKKEEKKKEETAILLSSHVFAFPKKNNDYENKIIGESGSYEIWHEKKIKSWAQSQGFLITENSPTNDLQFSRGIIFKPPGLFFELGIDAHNTSNEYRLGWILNLDMGFFLEDQNKDVISTNFKFYDNLIQYEIFVNDIHFKSIEIGYGRTTTSPVQLRIPFIRNREGKVIVKIKIANRPDNFGILYDASLSKKEIH